MGNFKNDKRDKNISWVVSHQICYSCGICKSICPTECITYSLNEEKGIFLPNIDLSECTYCAKCVSVCPSIIQYDEIEDDSMTGSLGSCISVYSSCSSNQEIRFSCASGGFITSFLIGLLDTGIIKAALVTKRSIDNPFVGESFLAYTREEILSARSSIYSPVDITKALEHLLSIEDETLKIAIVGLPCQLQGIVKFANKNRQLDDKIFIKISILCGQSPSLLSYNYILHQLGEKSNNIKKINNRGEGWPGYLSIMTKFNKEYRYKYRSYYSMGSVLSSPLFTPMGCQMCLDGVGISSDISVSDAWLDKFSEDKLGMNLVLIKTKKAEQLIFKIAEEGYILTNNCTIDDFIKANSSVINKQKKTIILRKIAFFMDNKSPQRDEILFTKNIILKFKMLIFYFHIWLIWKIRLNKKVFILSKPIILYFKVLNLLKR